MARQRASIRRASHGCGHQEYWIWGDSRDYIRTTISPCQETLDCGPFLKGKVSKKVIYIQQGHS